MYIAPNSEIRILSGVPLDNTYEHTIAWDLEKYGGRQNQTKYFLSKTKKVDNQPLVFKEQTYQRVKRNYLKIQTKAENLYDCNYLMFKNTSFENKWFYAFILSVEYVNNETSLINYEIDVMQTWLRGAFGDYTAGQCFVERQHTLTDEMFEHLVPEDVNLGQEYINNKIYFYSFNDTKICILTSGKKVDNVWEPWQADDGVIVNRVFGALHAEMFDCNQNGLEECNQYIRDIYTLGHENDIVQIYMVPSKLANEEHINSFPYLEQIKPFNKPKPGDKLGEPEKQYKPRNNKLYSYPYSRILASNQQGGTHEYKLELFHDPLNPIENWGVFRICGKYAWKVSAISVPMYYKGFIDPTYTEFIQSWSSGYDVRELYNIDEGLTLNNFPIGSWVGDGYKAYWAQNAVSLAGVFTNTGASAAVMAANAGVASAAAASIAPFALGALAIGLGVSVLQSLHKATIQPNKTYGDTNGSDMCTALGNLGFAFYYQSLRPEILKLYDDYFTKFGYSVRDIRYPGYINRKRWTYVKTIGFDIIGKLNNEDSKKICEIYDRGITFWVNPNDIGRYELDNGELDPFGDNPYIPAF